MTIATLQFTLPDQRVFSRLSGDFNPLHLDPIAARRVAAGEPIVHGIHLLLRALDAYVRGRSIAKPCTVSAGFQRPALLGDSIAVERTGDNHLELRIDRAAPLADIAIQCVEAGPETTRPLADAHRPAHDRTRTTPRVRAWADIAGAHGTIAFPSIPSIRRAFPHAARVLGADAVAGITAVSRLIGMECPGRDSLLSAVHLAITGRTGPGYLTWRVDRTDARFGLVRLEVRSGCVSGTVDAFLRPAPASAPSIEAVAAQVASCEFDGQRALIVGGSRGLGAAVALVVASGGGVPLVTFASGAAEAAALRREARRSGRRLEALRFDIINDPIERLARASARFGPTHLYYFATPRIFARRREPFDPALFDRFASFYVTGFANVCAAAFNGTLDVLYPSSVALDERPRDLMEYSAAKAAGEALSAMLQAATPGLRILVRRLPRIATDQTASIIRAPALDPVIAMLPIVREMHHAGGRHEALAK
jgi:NAD(P)-dependent dehydrogenase (short-subunit alcohol dehydrogenase family)